MSDAARIMLFRLFGDLAKARGWGSAMREVERERITCELFGHRVSWSELSHGMVDMLKARLIALAKTDDLDAQMADASAGPDGERRRLIFRIESDLRKGGFTEGYIRSIARDLYDVCAWRALDLRSLENLRDTLSQRVRSRRRAAQPQPAGNPY